MYRISNPDSLSAATKTAVVTLAAVLAMVLAAPAAAQSRGGPPGRGGFGGEDFRNRMLSRMDANGNGILEPNEVSGRAQGFVERMARDAGLDPSGPIRISSLSGRSSSRSTRSSSGDRGRESSSSRRGQQSSSGGDPYPLVAGFDGSGLLGFGIDPRTLGGRIVDLEARFDSRILERTAGVMERYDKNKNQVLEHSEWEGVSWQSDPRESDLDHDGQLTLAEMAERLAKREAGSRSSRNRSTTSSRQPDRGDSNSRSGRRGGDDRGGDRGRGPGGDRGRGPGGDRGRGPGGDRGEGGRSRGFDPSMMLRRFDRNGDGTIEPNELDDRTRQFAGRFLERLGVDPNKPIRIDELAKRIDQERERRSSGGDARQQKKSDVPERLAYKVEGAKSEGRRSFRARSQPLPEKMPDWWSDRDKNKDGQVPLSEYLTTRSPSAVKSFRNFDLNNDGVITAQEATLVEQGF